MSSLSIKQPETTRFGRFHEHLGITHELVAPADEDLEMRCVSLDEIESADIAL
jgi:hypothetical protein